MEALTSFPPVRVGAARDLAHRLLRGLPERWEHTAGVAHRAAQIAVTVGPDDGDLLVAAARGLAADLARYPREESPLADALTYADQTVGPYGRPVGVRQRMSGMLARHGADSPHARVHRRRGPYLLAVARRVQRRLARAAAECRR